MQALENSEMEAICGGYEKIPKGLVCVGAVVATISLFGSIFAGNIFGIITGPTVAGAAIAACII